MILNTVFLTNILRKHCPEDIAGYITDCSAIVLSSTEQQCIGTKNAAARFVLQSGRAAIIDNEIQNDSYTFGSPVVLHGETLGTVVTCGVQSRAVSSGNIIKAAVESALEYNSLTQSVLSSSDERTFVARSLIDSSTPHEKLVSSMNRLELDPSLFRSVICVSLVHHNPQYFNINLNLGYQSSIEKVNDEIVKRIRTCRFFNSQDLVLAYDQNTIIIIKSFIKKSELSKAYLCLDVICKDVTAILKSFTSFSFHVAYGNLYAGIDHVNKSYAEAREIIGIGLKAYPEDDFYIIEKLMFDEICNTLHPQIISKLLMSSIDSLRGSDGEISLELINTVEAFVDNCMNFTKTSSKIFLHRNTICSRLNQLKEKTGLDPVHNFSDAFIIKMIATYLKFSVSAEKKIL